jgi:glycosyltransferase involved in cell wall biosynthesis
MGSQAPAVSVLMPVHNGGRFVEDAVNSILLQTFDDFELIIGDDGSTDQTLEIISRCAAKDRRIRLIHNNCCQGISKTLNKAARQARGPLIARMDSDDWAHETRFSLQIDAFSQTENLVLCGSNATHVNEQMRHIEYPSLILEGRYEKAAASAH